MEYWDTYDQPDWDAEHELCDEFEAARAQAAPAQHELSQEAWEARMQDYDHLSRAQAREQCDAAAAVSEQTPAEQQPVRSVVWASAPAVEAVSVPHCEKLKFGGEDGHFVCTTKQGQRLVLGVADGVGGSRSEEDPENLVADWVHEVTSQLSQVLEECPELGMQEAVLQVLQGLPEAAPSTTLCFAFLEPGRPLRVLNLGDSRLAVFRHGQPVFITEPQQYPDCWNAPLQVRGGPLAAADLAGAVISEVEVLPGDVIAVGTDGFWDNLFLNKAAELVMEAMADRRGDAKGIANYLGEAACDNRRNNDAIVPFHVAWALAEGKTLDHVRLGGKEDDLTLLVTVVPEVVVEEEEEEEPTPCSSQSMEVEEEEVEGMVSTSANSMDDDVDFFDGFCFGEEEDDERCSLRDEGEWELPASTSSPARAAAFLCPCGPETDTTGKVNIITPISSSSGGGNSGACDQAVPEDPSSAHNVFDCSQTGGVAGQGGEGVGAFALVALGHAQAGTKVDAQTSSVFETAAAQGCALSRTSSLRSEALLGLSPQPSWAPEAPDAAAAPAVAAAAAAAALDVLATAFAAGYSSDEEGEGSDCSTSSSISKWDATASPTSCPTSTAAAAADKPLESHAAPWCGQDNAGSRSITSDGDSATMDAGSSPLLVSGCSDGQDTASTNSAAAAATGAAGAGDGNSNSSSSNSSSSSSSSSGRSSSSPILLWDFGISRTSSSSSSNGSVMPYRHAWSVIDAQNIWVYGNATYEHGSEACSGPVILNTCRWPTQLAAGLDSSNNKGSSHPSSVIGSIITSSSSRSSRSDKDSIGPQYLEGPLRCSSDREAPGVTPPPLCAQVGCIPTSSLSSAPLSPTAAPGGNSSSGEQQQSCLRAKCLLCGTRVTPSGAPHVCEIEPVVTGNVELAQQQQQEQAAAAASAASAKPSGWGKRVQAVMQRLRCVDNSRAAAADAAASHLQQQERSRLAGAKGAGVRSAACLSVIDEGDSAGVTSSGSMVTAQVLPLQPAAANEATPLPGSKGFKLWRSSSSGSSSLSRGDSSTLSTLMGSLGEVMGAGMFARRSTTGGSPDVPAKATTVATTTTSTTSSSSHPVVTAGGVAGPALSSDSVLMKGATYNTKVVGTDLAGDVGAVLVAAAAPDHLIQGGAAGGSAASSKRGSVKKFLSAWGCFGQPKVMH